MLKLEELFTRPRQTVRSYGEVLPWFGLVSPGLVLCHDGSLIAGFEYEGDDIEGVMDDAINGKINFLQNALRQFNDRITVWTVQERREAPAYEFVDQPGVFAGYVDYVWGNGILRTPNARFRHTIYVGYAFPNKAEALFEELGSAMDDAGIAGVGEVLKRRFSERSAVGSVRGRLGEMAEEFEQLLGNFESMMAQGFAINRMRDGELLGDLYARANLASPKGPLILPPRLSYLNVSIPADDVVRQGECLEFRGPAKKVYCAALSTAGFPGHAQSEHMDRLMSAPCEFILVQTFKFMERATAEASIRKAEEHYKNEVKSVATRVFEQLFQFESDKINSGSAVLAQDAQDALVELTADEMEFGYYNMTLLVMGSTPKEVNRGAEVLSTRLRTAGYTVARERQGLVGAFLGTLPGNHKAQVRKYAASVANLADLTPIRTISSGVARHDLFSEVYGREMPAHIRFPTDSGVTFDFSPHVQDLGHTVMIGGAGSGKTSFAQLLQVLFQKYYPSNTYIFDKDRSMALATVLLGGKHVDMSSPGKGNGPRINPVKRMLNDGNILSLAHWVEVLMAGEGDILTAEQVEKIGAAIHEVAELPAAHWRLSTIYSTLRGADKSLARMLAPFVDRSEEVDSVQGRGVYSSYFDNDEDQFSLGAIVCMETGKLLAEPKVAAPFMDYAFYCIEQKLDGVTPTMIYVEEAWYMLANERFEEKINDWLRTFRKKKAFVVFATQSPIELQRLRSWAAFIANVPTFIFLRSINDSVTQLAPLYRELFNLNDAQLALLSSSIPKRDYLLVQPGATRRVTATMPQVLLAVNAATSKPGFVERAQEYAARGSDGWEFEFLKEVLHVDV